MRRRRVASLGRAHTPSQKHAESTSATPNHETEPSRNGDGHLGCVPGGESHRGGEAADRAAEHGAEQEPGEPGHLCLRPFRRLHGLAQLVAHARQIRFRAVQHLETVPPALAGATLAQRLPAAVAVDLRGARCRGRSRRTAGGGGQSAPLTPAATWAVRAISSSTFTESRRRRARLFRPDAARFVCPLAVQEARNDDV
jgi:hypothetical protein